MTTLAIPDPSLEAVQTLCLLDPPYQTGPAADHAFVAAMRAVIDWHRDRCDFYRALLASRGFTSDCLRDIGDLAQIPPIHANFFKTHEVTSVPRDQIAVHLTSSGTTGQKSQIFFDAWSIGSAQRMVDACFAHYGWVTPDEPVNYLLYTYETNPGDALGTAYTDNFLCKYAPVNRTFAALRFTSPTSHEFDFFGTVERLRDYAREGLPVRIFGYPAFLWFTLERMRALGLPSLALDPRSLIFLGGGWKGHADKQISKAELCARVTEQLGIPDERIRDGYGSVEHCVPYVECPRHRFHVPVWSRVLVRDVETLTPLPHGQTGFLNFMSPYITSVPANSVLMGDLATLHRPEECGCGLVTDWFEVVGRAGTSKNRSCAVAAAELLKEKS